MITRAVPAFQEQPVDPQELRKMMEELRSIEKVTAYLRQYHLIQWMNTRREVIRNLKKGYLCNRYQATIYHYNTCESCHKEIDNQIIQRLMNNRTARKQQP